MEIQDREIETIIDQLNYIAERSISDRKNISDGVWELQLFSLFNYSLSCTIDEKISYYQSEERMRLINYSMKIIDRFNVRQRVQNN